jgi:UDP-N-acetylglucosamine:LPS N-acetylglucosamine transferase
MFQVLDKTSLIERQMALLSKPREALRDILKTTEPDALVSTYPAYSYVVNQIFRDHHERPVPLITVVTDSITVHSSWYGAPSDAWVVPNGPTARVMRDAGAPAEKVHDLGFPVSPRFALLASAPPPPPPSADEPLRALYLIHHGKKRAGKVLDELLAIPNLRLTITCGTDAQLRSRMVERARAHGDRVRVLGWTNLMPDLLASHHLLVTKAGGAITQEAIAARCPVIINQVVPGQEEGNARLVEELGVGRALDEDEAVVALVRRAATDGGKTWKQWRRAMENNSRPDAALRVAEFVLRESNPHDQGPGPRLTLLRAMDAPAVPGPGAAGGSRPRRPLLCDFHTHTNYSDGRLSVAELVDLYGSHGFDCVCITDHVAEKSRICGKLVNLSGLALPWDQMEEYFEVIARERRRAWRRYEMLLLAGLEFNVDGFTRRSSAHVLGIDLRGPIRPHADLRRLVEQIHGQGALAVASHPHKMKSPWGKNTLYLWEHQEEFAPLLDAWEIANRDDLFNPIGLKRLPFLANSDFHKPKHLYSWKTLLNCDKDPEAIKACVRENRDLAITLYRPPDFHARRAARRGLAPARLLGFPQAAKRDEIEVAASA